MDWQEKYLMLVKDLAEQEKMVAEMEARINEHVITYDRKLDRFDGSYSLVPVQNLSDPVRKEQEIEIRFGMEEKVEKMKEEVKRIKAEIEHLEWVKKYVRNQREHHAQGDVQDRLERIDAEEPEAQAEQREAP